jgi:hypothetical protein
VRVFSNVTLASAIAAPVVSVTVPVTDATLCAIVTAGKTQHTARTSAAKVAFRICSPYSEDEMRSEVACLIPGRRREGDSISEQSSVKNRFPPPELRCRIATGTPKEIRKSVASEGLSVQWDRGGRASVSRVKTEASIRITIGRIQSTFQASYGWTCPESRTGPLVGTPE